MQAKMYKITYRKYFLIGISKLFLSSLQDLKWWRKFPFLWLKAIGKNLSATPWPFTLPGEVTLLTEAKYSHHKSVRI